MAGGVGLLAGIGFRVVLFPWFDGLPVNRYFYLFCGCLGGYGRHGSFGRKDNGAGTAGVGLCRFQDLVHPDVPFHFV